MHALEVLELLATQPQGLTVPEIVARLDGTATEIIGAIAILQRRQWLSASAQNAWVIPRPIVESSTLKKS